MDLFKTHTQEEERKSLADFLPNGKAFGAKNNQESNLFKFLYGLGAELLRVESAMNTVANEHDIRTTTLLLEQWESALGIPDGCFSTDDTIENRRQHVLIKLSLAIGTRQSFIALANALGFTCVIRGGSWCGRYPLKYPWCYFDTAKTMNYTMYVHLQKTVNLNVYPFTIPLYPWPYSSGIQNIIECLFTKLVPATVNVVFVYDL